MTPDFPSGSDPIGHILATTRRIAVVGVSARPDRPSNGIFAFLHRRGFEVTGVNPGLAGQSLHGCPVVATLEEAGPLDMVDIFRNAEDAGPVVQDAIRLGARTVWMQLGVVNRAAAEAARAAWACPHSALCRLPDHLNQQQSRANSDAAPRPSTDGKIR